MCGGDAANVIPDRAYLAGTYRCMDENIQKQLRKVVEKDALDIAKSIGTISKFSVKSSCPSLFNDAEFRDFCAKSAAEFLGEEKIRLIKARGGGSEDFAFISRRVPSVMLAIAAGGADNGCDYPPHNPRTCYSEQVIKYGAAVYAQIALQYK